jgi:surfeit locus 1 family protein
MKTRIWPIILASAIGICILLSLGVWQVQRLGQKTALIASLEQRMKAEPISLAEAVVKREQGEDIEYLKVKLIGQLDPTNYFRRVTSFNGDPGWEIIAPFKTDDGRFVLVDMGAIAENQPMKLNETPQTIQGLVRYHNKGRGLFDNDNDAMGNIWYWWDAPAMLATLKNIDVSRAASFILQKLPSNTEQEVPSAEIPKVELANNHLGYAITWFGLAAALAGVAGFYMFSLRKTGA